MPNVQVRKCAEHCVLKVFKCFQNSVIKESATKLVLDTFRNYILAVEKADGSKDDEGSKCEHLKALHMLDLLKRFIPFLTKPEDMQEVILELQKCMTAKFSTLYVLDVMEEILALIESESELTFVKTVKISDKWKSDYSILIQSITGRHLP